MMYSQTKVGLDRTEIDAIIHTSMAATVTAVQEHADGMFNVAYRVDLGGGEPVFLKVAPPDSIPVLAYERQIMHTEMELSYRAPHHVSTAAQDACST